MANNHTPSFSIALQQVNIESEDISVSSLFHTGQSLDDVVDANTEFQQEQQIQPSPQTATPLEAFALQQLLDILEERKKDGKVDRIADVKKACAVLQQVLDESFLDCSRTSLESSHTGLQSPLPEVHTAKRLVKVKQTNEVNQIYDIAPPGYPNITPEIASFLTEKDPELLNRLATVLETVESLPTSRSASSDYGAGSISSFTSMISCSDSLALKESILGNCNHNTRTGSMDMERRSSSNLSRQDSISSTSTLESECFVDNNDIPVPMEKGVLKVNSVQSASVVSAKQPHLVQYPSDRISVTVEKKSYLTNDKDKANIRKLDHNYTSRVSSQSSSVAVPTSRMDDLESINSERLETISNLSEYSGYEDEMLCMKQLLRDPTSRLDFPKRDTNTVSHYINTLPEDQHKAILHEKINLEGRVEGLVDELRMLHNERSVLQAEVISLENSAKLQQTSTSLSKNEKENMLSVINQLENEIKEYKVSCEEMTSLNEAKDMELKVCKEELEDVENVNEKLRIEVEENRIETDAKSAAIQGLKHKVAELHVENQTMNQLKSKAQNDYKSLQNEMGSVQKSSEWYREQLHISQSSRIKLQKELMTSQSEVLNARNSFEKIQSQVKHLNHQLAELRRHAIKEKQALLHHLEGIEADMAEREALVEQISSKHNNVDAVLTKLKKMEDEKAVLNTKLLHTIDLEHDVTKLNEELRNKEDQLKNFEFSRAELLNMLSTLQTQCNNKELECQVTDNKHQELILNNKQLNEKVLNLESEAKATFRERTQLELILSSEKKEKDEINEVVEVLRGNFTRLSNNFHQMKQELKNRELNIVQLTEQRQLNLRDIEKRDEKLKSFQKYEKGVDENKLKDTTISTLEVSLSKLQETNKSLASKVSELVHDKYAAEQETIKVQELLNARELQLLNQHQGFEASAQGSEERDRLLNNIQKEKEQWKSDISSVEEMNATLQRELKNTQSSVEYVSGLLEKVTNERDLLKKENDEMKQTIESFDENKTALEEGLSALRLQYENSNKMEAVRQQRASETTETDIVKNEDHILHLMSQVGALQVQVNSLLEQNKKLKSECDKSEIINEEFQVLQGKCSELELELSETTRLKHQLNLELQSTLQEQHGLVNELQEIRGQREHLHNIQNSLEERLRFSEEECENYAEQSHTNNTRPMQNGMEHDVDEESQIEIKRLRQMLTDIEKEYQTKHKRYDSNIRILLKKLKEHIRARKLAEKQLQDKQSGDNVDLELEKAQGKLEGTLQSYATLKQHANYLESELARRDIATQQLNSPEWINKKEMEDNRIRDKLKELQDINARDKKIIRDIRKQVFTEKRETSKLRKQLHSLQIGLDTANQLVDTKKQEMVTFNTQLELSQSHYSQLQQEIQRGINECDTYKQEVARLNRELEDSRAKDPILTEQIKTLNFHLHQKNQELGALQSQYQIASQNHRHEIERLENGLRAEEVELEQLRNETEEVRKAKLVYQGQVIELRNALRTTIEKNKQMSSASGNDIDLSSLPSPSKYDESHIKQLLQQSMVLPQRKPLSDLKNCVSSLKHEMASLQKQLAEKTQASPHWINGNPTPIQNMEM